MTKYCLINITIPNHTVNKCYKMKPQRREGIELEKGSKIEREREGFIRPIRVVVCVTCSAPMG